MLWRTAKPYRQKQNPQRESSFTHPTDTNLNILRIFFLTSPPPSLTLHINSMRAETSACIKCFCREQSLAAPPHEAGAAEGGLPDHRAALSNSPRAPRGTGWTQPQTRTEDACRLPAGHTAVLILSQTCGVCSV